MTKYDIPRFETIEEAAERLGVAPSSMSGVLARHGVGRYVRVEDIELIQARTGAPERKLSLCRPAPGKPHWLGGGEIEIDEPTGYKLACCSRKVAMWAR